jgi:hypothetical protein
LEPTMTSRKKEVVMKNRLTRQVIRCRRFWISFISSNHIGAGCKKSPFTIYESGYYTVMQPEFKDDDCWRGIYCAVIDAFTEEMVWDYVRIYFPDFKQRFLYRQEPDWLPEPTRFPPPVKVGNPAKRMLK